MKVLIEIGHPAHVHFFRGLIAWLQHKGDQVILVTRNKEITNRLLDRLGLAYIPLSEPARGFGLFFELLKRWRAIGRIIRRERVDVAVSISGISTAVPARLNGIPNLTITDTEDAGLTNRIAFPFSDCILTPEFFLKDLGPRQVRYAGLHELAYLKAYRFDGLPARLAAMGLERAYSIIRLIAFDALHDRGLQAGTGDQLGQAVKILERLGRVYITSQGAIPAGFEAYRLQIPIEQIHDVLAGACCFVGESPTMAVEAGLLGTPVFLITARAPDLGNMVRLERLGLLRNYRQWPDALRDLQTIGNFAVLRQEWAQRAEAFRRQSVDVPVVVAAQLERLAAR